ncbi:MULTISPECIES: glycerophosphodiester phosphodiesterase [Pseudomonas]|uniref:glycerophosphodiester phosphodiesterase n=1 Tax=Pseudomonas TaxID=286 RepID=UPI00257C04AD|nr:MULTISPECIES: glycerophosphodiester phosphodiesterase [Pseudomonas]
MLRFVRFLLIPLLLLAAVLLGLLLTSHPASRPPVLVELGEQPLVIAHRGGMGLWPENTLFAFERADALGVDMLELDVRASRDGDLVVIHDEALERTSNGRGPVEALSLAQLQALDAGYTWTADGGETYPYRGQGIRIPSLAEVFARLPERPKSIEIKSADAGVEERLCALLKSAGQRDKVIVASFHERSLQLFRELCPGVATAAGPTSVRLLAALNWVGLAGVLSPSYQVLQIPPRSGDAQLASARLFASARARGLAVQLWTINEQPEMRQLLDMGADGLITDYPERALQLLGRPTRIAPRP